MGGGDDEWRATTIDDDDEVYTDHYVQPLPLPSSSAQVLKGYNRHQQEKNKENRNDTVAIPSRPQHLIQRQSNAQRVQFDEGLESQSTSSQGTVNPPVGRIARGAKRARNVVEGGDEDEQELLLSQDQGFEEMRQPLGLESRRRGSGRGVPASKRPPTYHPSQMTQEAEAEDAEEAEEVEGVQLTRRVPSTSINQSSPRITRGPSLATDVDGDPIDFKKINELAKRSAASKAPRKVQTRKAWSNESTNRLVEFIENDQFGTCWSRIDAQNDPLLEGRGQVGLKDKARNIKMEFLKYVVLNDSYDGRLTRLTGPELHYPSTLRMYVSIESRLMPFRVWGSRTNSDGLGSWVKESVRVLGGCESAGH